MARNAAIRRALMERVIPVCMTGEACTGGAPGRRLVRMHIIVLRRTIARGMAIYATRMGEYFADLGKHCARARISEIPSNAEGGRNSFEASAGAIAA